MCQARSTVWRWSIFEVATASLRILGLFFGKFTRPPSIAASNTASETPIYYDLISCKNIRLNSQLADRSLRLVFETENQRNIRKQRERKAGEQTFHFGFWWNNYKKEITFAKMENRRWCHGCSAEKKVNKYGLQSNFRKWKFKAHELSRQKVSSISVYTETRDHFEICLNSVGSGFGNPFHELNQPVDEHWRHSEVNHHQWDFLRHQGIFCV